MYYRTTTSIFELQSQHPSIAWGYGSSPRIQNKAFALLAIGWGPLIQILVLNDVMDTAQIFVHDGYHVICPNIQPLQESHEFQTKTHQPLNIVKLKEDQTFEQLNPYDSDTTKDA